MTPIERVARALCSLDGNPENATMDGKPLWQDYLPEGRAVITAIRDAFDESGMVEAARQAVELEGGDAAVAHEQIYNRVIDWFDAALAEGV